MKKKKKPKRDNKDSCNYIKNDKRQEAKMKIIF